MNLLPSPETREAVLKHPFILAGFAVVALLGLTAGVLVVIDSVRDDTSGGPGVVVDPKSTATQGPVARTATASGVEGITNTTTAVRFAPGARTAVLGTLGRGADVQIDGRTTDADWLRIVFPPNSELHGWVDAENLDVTGDPFVLAEATAEPPIVVDVPTQPPTTITPDDAETPLGTGTPVGTVTPDGLPDLVVGLSPTITDGKLFVTIVNQGSGDMSGDLVVAIFNFDGTLLIGGTTVPGFTLPAGQSIDVGTGYDVTEDQTITLVVDPNGDIEESDNLNNRVTIAIAVGDPDPTESPLGEAPPPAP